MTSSGRVKGRFVKQDFRYVADEDVYVCPADETLVYHYTNVEKGLTLRRYWTNACHTCALKGQNAPRAKSVASRVGSTSTSLRQSSNALTSILRK